MRIVFLGTPSFALPILEACLTAGELVAVVAQPDRPVGRSGKPQPPPAKLWAQAHGIQVLQPEKVKGGRLAALLSAQAPDVAVVAAYGRILPADALAAPRHGCLNVHASLLPELRGAAPAQWAIARGHTRTGVSIMSMDEGLDTGDLRLQRACEIDPGETAETLLAKLGALGRDALVVALAELERGGLPRAVQDHARATLAPLLSREDGRVDFARSAIELDQRRRGFTPWPGAWTLRAGALLKIHAAHPLMSSAAPSPSESALAAAEPGRVLRASAEGIDVACGAGTVWRLLELQPEGKKRMSAAAFLAGNALRAGERLGD